MGGYQLMPNPPAIVGEVQAGRSQEVRNKLEGLLKTLQKSTFDVAELLHEVKSKGYFNTWGYATFKDYVAELDIKTRKAQYLVRIVDVMEALELDRNTYEPIGLSKLREITSLDPNGTYTNPKTGEVEPLKDYIGVLIEKGKDLSLDEIKETVKTLKGLTGENELVWLNFSVKKAALEETIRPALDLAKMQIGSVGRDDEGNAVDASDGRALEVIAIEYLNDPRNTPLEAPIE